MMNQSGDLVCSCLFSCLIVFVLQAYKGEVSWVVVSSLFSPSLHHDFNTQIVMSSPIAFPFLFKEDACAQDVVESMEEVGGLF